MNNFSKFLPVLLIFIIGVLCGYFFKNATISSNNGTLFTWNYVQNDPLVNPSTNITDSATCRFRKTFNTFYGPDTSTNNPKPNDVISYVYGDDNEADTVTFVDLNTQTPKVKINTGQYDLKVLNDNPESITLISLSGIDKSSHGFSTYKISKHKGVLVYTDSFDSMFIGGPTGTLEMGYCN